MRAFVVRPIMTGLLALIIAGLWGMPLGTRGGGSLVSTTACRTSAELPPGAILAGIRRGARC